MPRRKQKQNKTHRKKTNKKNISNKKKRLEQKKQQNKNIEQKKTPRTKKTTKQKNQRLPTLVSQQPPSTENKIASQTAQERREAASSRKTLYHKLHRSVAKRRVAEKLHIANCTGAPRSGEQPKHIVSQTAQERREAASSRNTLYHKLHRSDAKRRVAEKRCITKTLYHKTLYHKNVVSQKPYITKL